MNGEFQMLIDLVQTFGTWPIFLFLFLKERKAHFATRMAHMADLRDIAGMSKRLHPPVERDAD